MPERPRWTRLVTEGAVIVVSVLLALAADAWWAELANRRTARVELSLVLEELEEGRAELEDAQLFHTRAYSGSRELRSRLHAVGEGQAISVPDSIASQLVWSIVSDPITSALDAFVAAGHLDEVNSPELRRALLGWKRTVEDLSDDEARCRAHIDSAILPYVEVEFDFVRPLDLIFIMWDPDADPGPMQTTELRSTRRLRNLVARQISYYQLLTLQSDQALSRLDQIIQLVEDELR